MTRPYARRAAALLLSMLAAFAALNAVAYQHAVRMVDYAPAGGVRTKGPDQLGWEERLRVLMTGVDIPRPAPRRTPADLGLPSETLRLASRDGTRLEAWWLPLPASRAVAVMLPGHAAERSQLLGEAQALRGLGFEALLLDFRGVGGSEGSETTIGWREAEDAAAAVALARRLAPGKPLVVYGKSMGAAAALRLAGVLGVEPDAMVLESPFDSLRHAAERRFTMMGLPAWPFTDMLLFWGGFHAGFDALALRPWLYARGVTCPVLLLQGARDKYVLLEDARRIAGSLPHGRLVVFPESGHCDFLRTAPALWRRTVAPFLAALLDPRGHA